MKTKQIIIALCLIAAFGLIVFLWQKSNNKKEQTPPSTNKSSSEATVKSNEPPIQVGDVSVGNAQTPTDAYRMLYAAVKAKNTDAVKRMMSQKTLSFAQSVSAQQNSDLQKVFENGFTATTFAPNLPQMRDERIRNDMGALEVWSEKDKKWEDLPFVKEADGWKLAIGDIFAGSYNSPGKGQAQIESEATNSNNAVPYGANSNGAATTNQGFKLPQKQGK